jgi:hypothetical protein
MKYPDSVTTKNRKGLTEVRNLIARGKFVKYNYTSPETGKEMENGKFSIVLKGDDGKEEHFFMIPAGARLLAIRDKDTKPRKVWNGKAGKAEDA